MTYIFNTEGRYVGLVNLDQDIIQKTLGDTAIALALPEYDSMFLFFRRLDSPKALWLSRAMFPKNTETPPTILTFAQFAREYKDPGIIDWINGENPDYDRAGEDLRRVSTVAFKLAQALQ